MTRNTARRELVAIVAFALCYAGVMATLIDHWATNPLFSYAFAVPLISGYVAWTRWQELRALHRVSDQRLGLPVTLIGAAMLVTGHLGAMLAVEETSLVVTLVGLVLLLFGRDVFRVLWFPILYLLLMVPIWDDVISHLQAPSQELSAQIAASMLRPFGVPAFQDDTLIVLPNTTLEVLRACSGVNQIVALVAMTVPAAYLWLEGYARRIALVGIAVVAAYLSNGLRIALIGVMAYNGLGDLYAESPLHLLQGLGVSVIGYLIIGAGLRVLSAQKRVEQPEMHRTIPVVPGVPPERPRRGRAWVEAAVLGVLILAGSYRLLFRPADVRLNHQLASIPSRIDDWTIDSNAEPRADLRLSNLDDVFVRTYRSTSGDRLQVYVGYHRCQMEGKELSGDAIRALDAAASRLTLEFPSGPIEVNQLERPTEGASRGIIYWYDVSGRVLADPYLVKGYTIWDALTRRRTNAAIVVIGWDRPAGAGFYVTREKAIGFARALMPLLRPHLPS